MKAAHVLAFVVVGIGAITGAVVFGQAPPQPATRPGNSFPLTTAPGGHVIQELEIAGPGFQDETAQLMDQYRKAQKDEDKKELRKKLADALGKEFDAHMKQQDDELTALEKQINDLKELMKKRLAARNTIIERRIDQMINDAEGLGWTAPGSQQHGAFWARPNPLYRSPGAAKGIQVEIKKP